MKRLLIATCLCLVLTGCATTKLPPVTSPEYAIEDDEKRLWLRSDEEERDIDKSGLVYNDRELNEYLDSLARKLQPPEVYKRIPFKIVVLKNPYSNAFAYPNGVIYVHTGILSRMDNEAQLATLLAHEMTHATHRHQISEFRGLKNKAAVFASLRSTIGALPAIGELTTVLGEIGAEAAITGHSRELETEADMVGIGLMVNAGYKPDEAPKLFKRIKEELDEEEIKEPFFFGSHPRLDDRVGNYEEYLKTLKRPSRGRVNAEVFRKKAAGAFIENAFLDLKGGRFGSARRAGEKYIAARPWDAKGYYLLGEAFRQRGGKGDMNEAIRHFNKAVSVEKPSADAYKGLGLIYFKEGKKSQAARAFRNYISLSPKAPDRSYVEDYLAQCK